MVDDYIKIRVKPDGSGVELANAKMAMNAFDEIAVAKAPGQNEAGKVTEDLVVSLGPAAETIRTGAMGPTVPPM